MKWENKKIGQLITQSRDIVEILPHETYQQVTVKMYHKGVIKRGEIIGMDIGSKQYLAREKQFIISKIDARNGASGLIPKELDKSVVTGDFLLFEPNPNEIEIEIEYFNYITSTSDFDTLCLQASEGSTNRRRLKVDRFLNLKIPLPPLPEQKRIVAKLDAVKTKIEEIKKLRAEQERDIKNFQSSYFEDLLNNENCVPIGDVLIPQRESVELKPLEEYKQITVRMNHQGVILRGMILGQDVGSNQYLASEGDFIISKIDARNAAMGIVPKELDGAIVTNDFPLYHLTDDIRVKYFDYFSNTYYFDTACKNASEGSTNRRRLKKDKFESILIPKPSIEKQDEIIEKLDKLNEIKAEHEATLNDLENLMPSLLDEAFKGEL